MNNTIIVRLTGKNGLTQTFRGTIAEIARYFEVKANSENELLRKLSYKFSINQVVTLAKRISKRNIDVAEELIKREEAKEKARLLEKEKEEKNNY